jgi:hypothetical protein
VNEKGKTFQLEIPPALIREQHFSRFIKWIVPATQKKEKSKQSSLLAEAIIVIPIHERGKQKESS